MVYFQVIGKDSLFFKDQIYVNIVTLSCQFFVYSY